MAADQLTAHAERSLARTLAHLLLAGLMLSGCTSGTVDKGGGSGGLLALTLASPELPGLPGSRDVEYFVEQVEAVTKGRMRVDITWDAGQQSASWDQKTAQQVIDGEADLGFIPARAWDTLGVTTLQALQAPFVVTSDDALDAVVSDPVAEQMLAGLTELGVTGLGLFPEGLRHPAGFGEPLLAPADFAGAAIRAPRSELTWETFAALGARPVDLSGEDEDAMHAQGTLRGAETSAAYLPELRRPAVITANLTPYAKANVLVANTEMLDALSDHQQADLRKAAVDTLAHGIESRTSDAVDLAAVCSQGFRVVTATAEQQAAMTASTQPVRDRLAADDTTGPFLARIAEIVDSSGPAIGRRHLRRRGRDGGAVH